MIILLVIIIKGIDLIFEETNIDEIVINVIVRIID